MSQEYKTVQASEPRAFQDQHGQKQSQWLKVQAGDGAINDVLINQLATTPAVQVGDSLYGDLVERVSQKGNTYFKFQKQQRPDGDAPAWQHVNTQAVQQNAPAPPVNGRSTTTNVPVVDERQRSIIRQHSQEMALRYLTLLGKADATIPEIEKAIDWFEKDATGGAAPQPKPGQETVQSGSAPSAPPPPTPGLGRPETQGGETYDYSQKTPEANITPSPALSDPLGADIPF